jgi:hypothetical protein
MPCPYPVERHEIRLAEYLLDEGRENSVASKRNGEYARDI